jgi:hypothetical protein
MRERRTVQITNPNKTKTTMSTRLELYPYQIGDCWVFDDEQANLKEEAFVQGMSEIISRVVDHMGIPEASKGFRMIFSHEPFEGYHAEICKNPGGSQEEGNWYEGEIFGEYMRGWLCPALYLYFSAAPARLYMRAERLPEHVNPIWTPEHGVGARRFVGVPVQE